MNKSDKANVGDVIQSEKFAFGFYDYENDKKGYTVPKKGLVMVDGKSKERPVQFRKPGTAWNEEPENLTVDCGAYEESRGLAKFVVEDARMDGGSSSGGGYPDGWHIRARRLNEDGSYNPDGEIIDFYQSGCFNCMVFEVEVVGKMKKIFVKITN